MMTTQSTNGKTPTAAGEITQAVATLKLEAERVRSAVAEHQQRVEELERHLAAERSRLADLRTILQHIDRTVAYLDHTPTADGDMLPRRETIRRRGLAGANVGGTL
jgi:chromosome segregation ATPase